MCDQKLYPSCHVKYLGVYIDKYLNWATHVNQLYVKLVKANAMLSKFDILLMTPLSYLSVLLSFIPICLTYVLLGDNPPFHLIECAFYREML